MHPESENITTQSNTFDGWLCAARGAAASSICQMCLFTSIVLPSLVLVVLVDVMLRPGNPFGILGWVAVALAVTMIMAIGRALILKESSVIMEMLAKGRSASAMLFAVLLASSNIAVFALIVLALK
jgi:hypothetical protein